MQVKINRAKGFLEKGDRVKITMSFRGRENAHKEIGEQKVQRFIDSLADISSISSPMKHDGSKIITILSPKSKKS